MKAVVFHGPRQVAVEEVADPKIEEPLDAIIKITTANICGSDLHPYDGRTPLDDGMVLGHENMGVVAETGPGVNRIKAGDRVSVPFNLACGTCRNCNDGWTSACLRANPSGDPGAGYGAAFEKGISIGSGQCPVKRYNRELRDLIIRGQARPSQIVSHELPLDQAADAYDKFDKRADGYTKVILHPGRAA